MFQNSDDTEKHDDELDQRYDEIIDSTYDEAQKTTGKIDDTMNETVTEEEEEEELPDVRDLMITNLHKLGCQPTKNDDGSISVQYQGENFLIVFNAYSVRVWDPKWATFDVSSPDLPKLREAVNSANYNFGATILLSEPDEEGSIQLHSKRDILFHPSLPKAHLYLYSVFDSFFTIKEKLRADFQNLTARQTESQRNRRPVGFTSAHTEV